MSIKNREDANKYYNQVNKSIDEYIEVKKIRPSKLGGYLKPGSKNAKRFLKRNNLSDIKGADRVLSDVIEDRVNMEEDGVLTFESFKYFESDEFKISNLEECLYKGIDKSTEEMEKVLHKYFDIDLGSIIIKNPNKHKYEIQDWSNDDWNVVIYSKEEYEIILYNVIDHLYEELNKKEISLIEGVSIKMSSLIDKEAFEKKMSSILNEEKLNKIISECLGKDWSFKVKTKFKEEEYFIWIY